MISFARADQRVTRPDRAFGDQRFDREESAEQLERVEAKARGFVLRIDRAEAEMTGQCT